MALSKNIANYIDIKDILDRARRVPLPTYYRLPTPGKARHWAQRAYAFRRLVYELEVERHATVPGWRPSTPYDYLAFQVNGDTVKIYERKPEGVLLDEAGQEVHPTGHEEDDDELLEAAREAAKRLGLDD